jgi:hypothetical protein
MDRQKAGRIRKSALVSGTAWRKTERQNGKTIVTTVFIDLNNPVTPSNKRALIQTKIYKGFYWESDFTLESDKSKEITIQEALDWCQRNEGLISSDKNIDWKIVRQHLTTTTA